MSRSKHAMVFGCLWILSAILLLPGLWIGFAYKYNLSDWLSLLSFPGENEEFIPWVVRTILFVTFIGSTVALAVIAVRNRRSRSSG